MKKLLFTFIMLSSFIAYSQSQKTYQLDTKKSILKWTGSYAFKFHEYNGTVTFNKGKLHTSDGTVTGGSFELDMTTITTKEYAKSGNGPVSHLKDEDFFHVKEHPTATLKITKVEYFENGNEHWFYADLTIKEVTKPIKFSAYLDGKKKTMTAKFKLDRNDWGITYNHKLKNDFISDTMGFETILYF